MRERSRRSRAGRSSLGKRMWSVRRACWVCGVAFVSGVVVVVAFVVRMVEMSCEMRWRGCGSGSEAILVVKLVAGTVGLVWTIGR